MTGKTMIRTVLVTAGALGATVIAGTAAQAATGADERRNPGMQRMHELHMQGNPGMHQMHQMHQMHMQGNPGMQRMHQMMQGNGGMHVGPATR